MATMIRPTEAPQTTVGPIDPIVDTLNDVSLTMGEKLLRIEALLVHDSCGTGGVAWDLKAC